MWKIILLRTALRGKNPVKSNSAILEELPEGKNFVFCVQVR